MKVHNAHKGMAPVLCDWRMYDDEEEHIKTADDKDITAEISSLIYCNKVDFDLNEQQDNFVQVDEA